MERLTKRMCGGFGVMPGCELNTAIGAKAVVDRLAAYEDTGLEPIEYRGRRKEYRAEDFGKTVFLTREEAEAALEKRE